MAEDAASMLDDTANPSSGNGWDYTPGDARKPDAHPRVADTVTPEQIADQRARGWPDFHPEDYCHRCGHPNVKPWLAPSDLWNEVMRDQAAQIVCPRCFAELADRNVAWVFMPEPLRAGWITEEDE